MNLEAKPQFLRTLLYGFIGGSVLTNGAADIADGNHLGWLWLTFGAVSLAILLQFLREQALRGLNGPDATWSRSDTANAATLAVLVAFHLADTFFDGSIHPTEQAAAYLLAAVYTGLLLDFTVQRRQTIQTSARDAVKSA